MDLPAILPPDLKSLEFTSDQDLFEQLVLSTKRLTLFFSYAADDETWSSKHGEFYKLVLAWFTRQYLQDRVGENYLQMIIRSFHEHYPILEPYLPRPVQLGSFPVNPFIVGVLSPYLRLLMKSPREIHEPLELVQFTIQYLESGSAEGLWKYEQKTLLKLLELAEKWGVSGLSDQCQEILKRYISQENVSNELLLAVKKERWILLERCRDVFNEKFVDGLILSCGEANFVFEFVNFEERALLAFDGVKHLITHLCFKGNLTLDEQFAKVMGQTPRLIGLILSGTESWSPFFPEIPQKVYDLNLSQCAWLGDNELRSLFALIPRISILNLAENTQFTYRGFAELKNLPGLKALSLKNCFQLDNDSLNLILQGSGGLTELNLYGCRKLSDISFYELGKRAPHLTKLNLSRTTLSDGALADICFKCQELAELTLDHCLSITLAGLFDSLRLAKQLKVLSIQENRFEEKGVRELKAQYPDITMD